jgi:hypothetical protein
MSFYTRYELERLLADGEAKTFRAIESATGRIVFLHLFNPRGQALLAELKAKLVGAGGKPAAPLIEIGEFAGSQYAVTESSEGFSGLRDWLSRQVEAAGAPIPAPPAPVAVAQAGGLVEDGPGEFTKLFAAPEPAVQAAEPVHPPAAAQPGGLLNEEPGEFTRLFPLSEAAAPLSEPVRPPAASTPSGLVDEEPGEFTRLFPLSEPVRPPVASTSPGLLDDAAGEFQRSSPPSRPAEATRAPAAEREPGEFTRAFGPAPPKAAAGAKRPGPVVATPPGGSSAELPSAPADWMPADTGEFTKLFGSGLSGEAIDIAGEQARAARSTANESRPFQKAGEFTRIFGPGMGEEGLAGQPSGPSSLNTAASLFGNSDEAAKLAKEAADAPRQAGQRSDPGEYTRIFGEKPEASKPPEAAKPAAVAMAPPKPKMPPAAIALMVAAAVVLVALIVLAVVLSQR